MVYSCFLLPSLSWSGFVLSTKCRDARIQRFSFFSLLFSFASFSFASFLLRFSSVFALRPLHCSCSSCSVYSLELILCQQETRYQDARRAGNQKSARIRLDAHQAVRLGNDGARNRRREQAANRLRQVGDAVAVPNLPDRRDLRNQRHQQRNVRAREQPKHGRKRNRRRVLRAGNPHGQHEYAGDVARRDEGVEAAKLVRQDARADAPNQARAVVHGHEVLRERLVHAGRHGHRREVVDGRVQAKRDEEEAQQDEDVRRLLEGLLELRGGKVGLRSDAGAPAHRGNGDEEQRGNQKGAGAHGPAVADPVNHVRHHDGEHDAAQAGTGGEQAKGEAAAAVEPAAHAGDGREEDGGDANGAAHALRQKELVVLCGDGGHHETKDVQEGAGHEQPLGPVLVKQDADEGAHEGHEEDLQRGDPRDLTGRVVLQRSFFVVLLENTDT